MKNGLAMNTVTAPRAALPGELPRIIELIDQTFRLGYPPTMGREFSHMLCEANIDNVRVIAIDGKPVAVLGIYPSRVALEGSVLAAASIGAVCTDPEYRMRGFASALMDDALDKRAREKVYIRLISGRQKIYLQRGCTIVGNFHDCVMDHKPAQKSTIDVREMGDSDVGDAVRLYSREPVRFCRTYDEFRMLLDNATLDHSKYIFRKYVVTREGRNAAYLILRLTNEPTPVGMIIEYAGERSLVCEALPVLFQRHGISRLTLHLPDSDPLLDFLRTAGMSSGPGTQEGCVRIISFSNLMMKLAGYYAQRLPKSLCGRITFNDTAGKWAITDGEGVFETADISVLSRLVFDGSRGMQEMGRVREGSPLDRFMHTVFPLPFPSAKGMNYI